MYLEQLNINRCIATLDVASFNFTSVGGHLAPAQALWGNTLVSKSSSASSLSKYVLSERLEEASLPKGCNQFLLGGPDLL